MAVPPSPDPTVSVIIPCYRQAEFLTEALASVEYQTRDDWEAIVIDDGSPDETAAVAERAIARLGSRVRLIRQANSGVAAARNAGIAAAKGRYIVPLDADDRIHPEFIARTVGLLEDDPSVGVAYTDYEVFGVASRVVKVPEFDFDGLCRGNHILNTAAYPRAAWVAVGGYSTRLTLAFEDWDFWIGCAKRGYLPRRVPGVLVAYRLRSGTRNDRNAVERRAMTAVVEANHPELFTPRRRFVRRLRRAPRNALRQLGRFMARATGGRIAPPPERW